MPMQQTHLANGLKGFYDTDSGRYFLEDGREARQDETGQWMPAGGGEGGINLDTFKAIEEQKRQTEAARVAALQAQGYDSTGRPLAAQWNSLLDGSGNLQDKYKLNAQPDVQIDPRAMDAIRQSALRTGPSAWANMAMEKQKLEELSMMDKARQQSAGAQAQNLNALMMRGGLSGGARERMARAASRDQAMGAQGVYRQGQMDRMGINLQDEQNRRQDLNQVANLDFQKANLDSNNRAYRTQVDTMNLQSLLKENEAKRMWDANQYNEKMRAWAAGKQADAQREAGGGGK